MLEDRCPHRSAPLSVGQHLGDRVACLYHGVQVDGTGTVVSVPGMPGCALEGKRATASRRLIWWSIATSDFTFGKNFFSASSP